MAAKPLQQAALALLGAYSVLVGSACALQRRMLFPAPTPADPPPSAGQLLTIPTPSGPPAFALHCKASEQARTVVHFHGNGEQLADVAALALLMRERGLNVLAVEYPGYGLAAAQSPSEQALYEAAEAVLSHLHDALLVPPSAVTLQGQSLGTGVASEMALRGHGSRLALLSPYTSIPDVAARLLPLLPARYAVVDRFETEKKAPRISVPTLIIHGERDALIPASMGRALGRAFPHASVEVIAQAHHNDLFAPPHGAQVLERLIAFASAPLAAPRAAVRTASSGWFEALPVLLFEALGRAL